MSLYIIIPTVLTFLVVWAIMFFKRRTEPTEPVKKLIESREVDVTEKVVALGAPPLPEGVKYIFRENRGYNRPMASHDIIIRFDGKFFSGVFYEMEDEAVSNLYLSAAKSAYHEFYEYYSTWKKRQDILSFALTDMPVIGEKQEWVDDDG